MIIAVDGPAASGKGTIARALAAHFKLPHMDTGLLYRAVGLSVLRSQGDPEDAAAALSACGFANDLLNDPALRSEDVARAASIVSVHPAVRQALFDRQRAFALQPGGAVLDGRDIGSVVMPDADAKLFVTARADVRAQRRHLEQPDALYDDILADILKRDARDSERKTAPLTMAADADLLETTNLAKDAAIQQAILLVGTRLNNRI
jgi:CMP/dCMP kinase